MGEKRTSFDDAIEAVATKAKRLAEIRLTARDVLFGAASNLECGAPQPQPTVAAKLRLIADLFDESGSTHTENDLNEIVEHLSAGPR